MKPTPKKNSDCVAFKRRVQSRIYEEIRGLKHAEEIAYFRRAAGQGSLGSWWASLSSRQSVAEQPTPYRT